MNEHPISPIDLFQHFIEGRPYLIIMRNGHEYNGFLDKKHASGWITGKVAKRMMVTLYDPGEDHPGLLLSLDDEESAKKKFADKEVLVQEPCYVRHEWQSIRVWAGDISILEDSWRRPVYVDDNGNIDEEKLVITFPGFAEYRRSGGGFCTNPAGSTPPSVIAFHELKDSKGE
jgi:hypothetical protein